MAIVVSDDPSRPLVLAKTGPVARRAIMLAGGLAAFVLPAYDLRHAFQSFGWWTIVFGGLVLVAWSIGAVFLYGAILAEDAEFRVADGVLDVTLSSAVSRRTMRLTSAEIKSLEIREIDWDSRAPTYAIVVSTTGGERLETPDVSTRGDAEALERDIRNRLGM